MPCSPSASSSPCSSSTDHTSDTPAPRSRRARVSAEHTLNRVRENQRRHRARQRDHVASLEQKLAETEKLLAEARAEIAMLRQEATACPASTSLERPGYDGIPDMEISSSSNSLLERHVISSQQAASSLSLIQPPHTVRDYPDGSPLVDASFFSPIDPSFYLAAPPPSTPTPTPTPTTTITTLPPPTTGPPPCCSAPPRCPPPAPPPVDLECSSCKTRPPPAPTESTTLCAQAYVMIRQQNFRNLDPDTIRLWLAQGLRRAQREGEGCRVENGALLRLLDFISGL